MENEELLLGITQILMELNGYSIRTAFDCVERINRFGELKNRRDFVACDFNMPR